MQVLNLPSVPYMVCGGQPKRAELMPHWEGCKVPPLPRQPITFSDDSNELFKFLCECISHGIRKSERKICSVYALNRRIQNAYPQEPIRIDFTQLLCMAWRHAGIDALAKMAESPPIIDGEYWRFPSYSGSYPVETLAVEKEPPPDASAFFTAAYYLRCIEGKDGEAKYWFVAAADNFGKYSAYLISDTPPDNFDIQGIVRWECRVH